MGLINAENKEIVPSSVKSVSTNVWISRNRDWLFYNYGEINRVLRQVDELLKEPPKYLLDDELAFLSLYKKDFSKRRIHNQFMLATPDYIHLLTKALEAMEMRITLEEETIFNSEKDRKIKGQITVAFSQISALLRDIRNTFFTDLEMIKQEPRRYIAIFGYLSRGVEYLLRSYVYEHQFFSNPKEMILEELIEFNTQIDTLFITFNQKDFATPSYKLDSQIYEIYA